MQRVIIFINHIFVPGNKETALELLSASYTGTDKNCDNNLYVEPHLYMENVATKISREEN